MKTIRLKPYNDRLIKIRISLQSGHPLPSLKPSQRLGANYATTGYGCPPDMENSGKRMLSSADNIRRYGLRSEYCGGTFGQVRRWGCRKKRTCLWLMSCMQSHGRHQGGRGMRTSPRGSGYADVAKGSRGMRTSPGGRVMRASPGWSGYADDPPFGKNLWNYQWKSGIFEKTTPCNFTHYNFQSDYAFALLHFASLSIINDITFVIAHYNFQSTTHTCTFALMLFISHNFGQGMTRKIHRKEGIRCCQYGPLWPVWSPCCCPMSLADNHMVMTSYT
jgi:hypothetical protein